MRGLPGVPLRPRSSWLAAAPRAAPALVCSALVIGVLGTSPVAAQAPAPAPPRPAGQASAPAWPTIPWPAASWNPVSPGAWPWGAPSTGTAPSSAPQAPSAPVAGGATVTFRRGPDYAFRPRGGAPRERSLGQPRDHAWVADDGATILAAGGGAGTLFTPPGSVALNVADVFDARFTSDASKVAIVQARSPLSVRAVPSGQVLWQHAHGLGCAARWESPTLLVAHDDGANGRLWHVDFAASPPRVTPLGGARRADACWASPDGRRWLVRDDYAQKGGVVWLVDGDTGAASVLAQQASGSVVGSPMADRVCFDSSVGAVQCVRVYPRTLENVATDSNLDIFSAIDDTGARMLFTSRGATLVADFATGTVRAAPQAPLRSGGSLALLSGGHLLASGSSSDATVFDLDQGTMLVRAVPRSYSVRSIDRRPRSLLVAREESAGQDLYLEDLPP